MQYNFQARLTLPKSKNGTKSGRSRNLSATVQTTSTYQPHSKQKSPGPMVLSRGLRIMLRKKTSGKTLKKKKFSARKISQFSRNSTLRKGWKKGILWIRKMILSHHRQLRLKINLILSLHLQDSGFGIQDFEEEDADEDIVSQLQRLEITNTDVKTKQRVLSTIFKKVDKGTKMEK